MNPIITTVFKFHHNFYAEASTKEELISSCSEFLTQNIETEEKWTCSNCGKTHEYESNAEMCCHILPRQVLNRSYIGRTLTFITYRGETVSGVLTRIPSNYPGSPRWMVGEFGPYCDAGDFQPDHHIDLKYCTEIGESV
jgi:hypothetical protein